MVGFLFRIFITNLLLNEELLLGDILQLRFGIGELLGSECFVGRVFNIGIGNRQFLGRLCKYLVLIGYSAYHLVHPSPCSIAGGVKFKNLGRNFCVHLLNLCQNIEGIALQSIYFCIVQFPLQLVDTFLQFLDFLLIFIVIIKQIDNLHGNLHGGRNNG